MAVNWAIDKTGLSQRLASVKPKGVSDAKWAEALGIRRATWSSYVSGATYPGLDLLIVIKTMTGVSLDWLATGQADSAWPLDLKVLEGVIIGVESIDRAATRDDEKMSADAKAKVIAALYKDRIKVHYEGIEANPSQKRDQAS